jgi:hypothetical protein
MTLDRTVQNEIEEEDNEYLEVPSPTDKTYRSFYEAYEHFNAVLFDNQLSGCLFTMQRRKRTRGFFAPERFGHRRGNEIADEIALNPRTFLDRTDREIISTVVHEMVHQWQQHHGKPGRRGYHNKQWAAKMNSVGLVPTHTGGLAYSCLMYKNSSGSYLATSGLGVQRTRSGDPGTP